MTTGIAVVVGSWLQTPDVSGGASEPATTGLAVSVPFILTCTFLAFVCNNARQARQRLQRGLAEMQDEVGRREQAIEARLAAEAEVNAFFLLAGVGMAITEARTGRFLRVNPELCRMLDYDEEEVLKLHYLDVTPLEDRDWTTQQLVPFMRGETTFLHLENRLLLKNGSYLWVDAIGTELPASTNHPRRMIVIFLDLTDRKTAEVRITEADRRKDEFLAMLSHELRNPLAAIRQALQLAEDEVDPATRQWTGEVLTRQT
ncbi:MAG: PAS domain S-box protein, partial [Chthoniobacteraceae bacterium]